MVLSVSIRKKLRDFKLNLNFSTENKIFALFGASGCGKSMTLKMIAGIESPDEGKIILDGKILFDSEKKINLPPQMRKIGYLFQNYALFPNMTVSENILFAATGSKSEKIQKLQKNLKRFELFEIKNSYPKEISGGQQQRVALARILASNAKFLLLDEPFSALDSHLKFKLEIELAEILKNYNHSAILVSHDKSEIFRLSEKIAVMNRGKIEEINFKREIFENPKTFSAAILTGCKNISVAKKIAENKIFAEDWQITLTVNKKIPDDLKFIGIHANYIKKVENFGENIFQAEIFEIIEDADKFIILLKIFESTKKIFLEIEKNFWKNFGKNILVEIPSEKIILMNG